MKVSIIMPVYNQEELIGRAIESIPFDEDLELVVVDDGSTDRTVSIVREYMDKNPKIRLFSYEENKGVGYAKNVAYDNCQGEYINELDSDDYFYTEEYRRALRQLDGTDMVYIDLRVNNGSVFPLKENTKRIYCAGIARFIRREFMGGLRCPEVRFAEDWFLNEKLLETKPTEKFTRIVAYHYNHPRENSLCWEATYGV